MKFLTCKGCHTRVGKNPKLSEISFRCVLEDITILAFSCAWCLCGAVLSKLNCESLGPSSNTGMNNLPRLNSSSFALSGWLINWYLGKVNCSNLDDTSPAPRVASSCSPQPQEPK